MRRVACPCACNFSMRCCKSLRMAFRGLGDFSLVLVRRCSYSRLNALPTDDVAMDPVQTRYAVITLKSLLSFPRYVCPLHLPSPVGSWMSVPSAMDTNVLFVIVRVPPD